MYGPITSPAAKNSIVDHRLSALNHFLFSCKNASCSRYLATSSITISMSVGHATCICRCVIASMVAHFWLCMLRWKKAKTTMLTGLGRSILELPVKVRVYLTILHMVQRTECKLRICLCTRPAGERRHVSKCSLTLDKQEHRLTLLIGNAAVNISAGLLQLCCAYISKFGNPSLTKLGAPEV